MRAEGVGGELRHGYALVARLGPWKLTPADAKMDQHHVSIAGAKLDPFLKGRRPLTLVLRLGDQTWTWDDADLIGGGRVLIEGAPVERVKVLNGT